MKIKPAEYTKPVAEPKAKSADPEVVALVTPLVERGIDTAFSVDTTKASAAADKAKIQVAVNSLGFTAREVEKLDEDTLKSLEDDADVTLTFVVRPKRKPRGSQGEDAPASE